MLMADKSQKKFHITFCLSDKPKHGLVDKLTEEAIKRALAEYLDESNYEEFQKR